MLMDRILDIIPTKSSFIKLLIGSIFTALFISLAMVYILKMFHFIIDPVIPSTFAAIGSAIFAAHYNKTAKG
jgi:hypothetical protein